MALARTGISTRLRLLASYRFSDSSRCREAWFDNPLCKERYLGRLYIDISRSVVYGLVGVRHGRAFGRLLAGEILRNLS